MAKRETSSPFRSAASLQQGRAASVELSAKAALKSETRSRGYSDISGVVSSSGNTIYFKDFMIDVKDSGGKSNVLMCDVAVDTGNSPQIFDASKSIDVRNIIYRIMQSRNASALKSPDERKKIRKEITMELNKLLGPGVVQDISFVNYFVM